MGIGTVILLFFGLIIISWIIAGTVVINKEYERALKFRLGSFRTVLGPGINFKIPFIEDINRIDYRVKSEDVEPQAVMTKDNVTVSVDAIVFFKVREAKEELKKAILEVEDYQKVTIDYAQTMLRNIIGKKELDEVLQKREEIAEVLRKDLDKETDSFGVKVNNVEIKDVSVPDDLERAMASEAEAERQRRAKIKESEGELQAAQRLRLASEMLGTGGYQLRTLQTVDNVAKENSTIITVPASLIPPSEDKDDQLFGDILEEMKDKVDLSSLLESGNIGNLMSGGLGIGKAMEEETDILRGEVEEEDEDEEEGQ